MARPFQELICNNDIARFLLSQCIVERGPVATFFYNWQSLIGGVLALVAGLIGGGLLWIQINDQRKHAQRRIQQQTKVALIPVPHALVAIQYYLSECYTSWLQQQPDKRPEPPTDALTVIMNAAPYLDKQTFESFQQLIIKSQVFESRLGKRGEKRRHNILDTMIMDLAEYSYLTTRLINLGRITEGVTCVPYISASRSDLEQVLKRDFGLFGLLTSDPTSERLARAFRRRFGNDDGWPGTD
ncbi:hypothetical protein [Ochrobactrum chromiisoli]|uniref:Uncharacterized protein n=1 Tax=Ochrobactrum chromiisoli TaxID=2993941 RepID=A0ABT3QSQ1_9HYPH|nr:hypothetical protein [Ochrobactrum chromiisoli]MCX2698609.1 hypothetical protein [Ochrobactrum chromiisoli]